MYSIEKYHFAVSPEEAFELLKKSRRNVIFGGSTWLRMGRQNIGTAIDLSKLGLNTIVETEEAVRIGASVTLRDIETAHCLKTLYGGVLSACVAPIVGVQFRNRATIGANVYSRCGFSDVIPVLLALDASVRLCGAGLMTLADFLKSKIRRDILIEIIVPKKGQKAVVLSHRRTATDLSQMTVCLAQSEDGSCRIAVGARPGRAMLCERAALLLAEGQAEQAALAVREDMTFGSDLRASADYRRNLSGVLMTRAWNALKEVR